MKANFKTQIFLNVSASFFVTTCIPFFENSLTLSRTESKPQFLFIEAVTPHSAEVSWGCSEPDYGMVSYGTDSGGLFERTLFPAQTHVHSLRNLPPDTEHTVMVFCSDPGTDNFLIQFFETLPAPKAPLIKDFVPHRDLPGNVVFVHGDNFRRRMDENQVHFGEAKAQIIQATTNELAVLVPKNARSSPITVEIDGKKAVSDSEFIVGIPPDIIARGIWLVGGMGFGGKPIASIDLFDPITGRFYPNVTHIPTPRIAAGVASARGKLYVLGGIFAETGQTTNRVDVYDPLTDTWSEASPMLQPLQGFLADSLDDKIYLLGGSTTANMDSGTLADTVYVYSPDLGSWDRFVANGTLPANVDMSGCLISGLFLLAAGRWHVDGTPQDANDGYLPALNRAVSAVGSAFYPRHGAAGACHDGRNRQEAAFFLVGGSESADLSQPPRAMEPSRMFEFYFVKPDRYEPAQMFRGSNLPSGLYAPAAAISYDTNRLYVFGGASVLNVPTKFVFSLDLDHPLSAAFLKEGVQLPVARYGHWAIQLRGN